MSAGSSYTVKTGDTVPSIAAQQQVPQEQISGFQSGSPSNLVTGEKVQLAPSSPTVPTLPAGDPQNQVVRKTQEMDKYLQDFQAESFDREAAAETDGVFRSDLEQSIRSKILPEGEAPTAPNLEETFGEMRGEFGLDSLDQQLAELKKQERDIGTVTRARFAQERGKSVALNVMEGRTSEVNRQQQEQLSFIQNEARFVSDQIKSANSAIQMFMNFKQQDYGNARQEYEFEYKQNLQMYDLVQGELDKKTKAARANLQVYMDMITTGKMHPNDISEDTKLQLNKLELQSGLPKDFVTSLKMPEGDKVRSVTTRVAPDGRKYADVLSIGVDGKPRVKSQLLGTEKSTGGGSRSSSSSSSSSSKTSSSFYKDLERGLGSNIASTVDQEQGFRREGDEYINREVLIQRLQQKYGSQIEPGDIERAVYEYYADNGETGGSSGPSYSSGEGQVGRGQGLIKLK